jgi:hypothetical protein
MIYPSQVESMRDPYDYTLNTKDVAEVETAPPRTSYVPAQAEQLSIGIGEPKRQEENQDESEYKDGEEGDEEEDEELEPEEVYKATQHRTVSTARRGIPKVPAQQRQSQVVSRKKAAGGTKQRVGKGKNVKQTGLEQIQADPARAEDAARTFTTSLAKQLENKTSPEEEERRKIQLSNYAGTRVVPVKRIYHPCKGMLAREVEEERSEALAEKFRSNRYITLPDMTLVAVRLTPSGKERLVSVSDEEFINDESNYDQIATVDEFMQDYDNLRRGWKATKETDKRYSERAS